VTTSSLCHSRNLLSGIQVFKYFWTPDRSIQGQAKSGLKIAGVTKKAIEPFRNNGQGDDRSIQGQAKNGSEVAGVTKKKGVHKGKMFSFILGNLFFPAVFVFLCFFVFFLLAF